MTNAKPIIPWIGGKRRIAKHILPMLGDHTCYVEPFCGAAAIFFLKDRSKFEVINDVNGELVNLYRVVKHHLEELSRSLRWEITSRQGFEWHQESRPETLTDVQRAVRFYYLQKLSFGGKVVGQTLGTSAGGYKGIILTRLEEELSQAHLRLQGVMIEREPWEACIKRYDRPSTVFYCDPPYWQTEGYGVDFGWENYERLASLGKSIQGRMIVSHTDHPEIRRLFKGWKFKAIDLNHTLAGGGRAVQRRELVFH